jgi:hypothetical protein
MENIKFDKITVSMLFSNEPETGWGARGNPHLWDEMRLKSKNIELLGSETEMKDYFYKLFTQITGVEIIGTEYIKINRYLLDSGMSNGIVTCSWWIEKGIPILLERYKKIKDFCTDSDSENIDINFINNFNKNYRDGIESAIRRIFMFDEIKINNLKDLLSIDDNMKKITKKTKDEIIKKMKYKIKDENKVIEIMDILNGSKKNGTERDCRINHS